MKKIAYDGTKLDALKIVEDSKCCLKVNAVITKEGVYPYPDGRAFKSRMELLRATHTAQNAKVTIMDHPDSMVIMSQSQIYGTVEKPFFDRDKIRATISFDKRVCPPRFLYDVRNGKLKDVSIGFYYQPDLTPGLWNGQRYDYVMRDIVIDHVAAGVIKGRCTFPDCGIGVDAMMRNISFQSDKVVKRGNQWCVVHCHPDGSVGETIKCFPTEAEAQAMHRAIQAKKHGAQNKPPKEWMDKCKAVVREGKPDYTDEQVNAVCGNIWHHHPEQHGIGDSWVSNYGGTEMSKKTDFGLSQTPEEIQAEYAECVRQRMAEGMTRGEAEAHCQAATKPQDEPTPPPGIDQEPEFAQCVKDKMAEGMTKEEAEKACKPPAEDQADVVEETPLQRCISAQMEQGKSEEEATEWCKAELAGEHQETDALIGHSQKLLRLREQRNIERRRESRRSPL